MILNMTAGQGRSHVRAKIVDCKVLAVNQEDTDDAAIDGKRAALAFGDSSDFGDGFEFRHETAFGRYS